METLMVRLKILRLVNKIRRIKQKFPDYRWALEVRNVTYHSGRLDTDRLFNEYIYQKNIEIFAIKREIVSLKNKLND